WSRADSQASPSGRGCRKRGPLSLDRLGPRDRLRGTLVSEAGEHALAHQPAHVFPPDRGCSIHGEHQLDDLRANRLRPAGTSSIRASLSSRFSPAFRTSRVYGRCTPTSPFTATP